MKKSLLSLVAIAAISSSAYAVDVKMSGFINVVGGINDVDPSKFISGTTSTNYMGYDDKYDFQNESLAALQFSTNIMDNMGATVQLIAQNDSVDDDIRMEWGYISYDLNDEIRMLIGRIRPALFLYSDYLDVGYAYNWITPPAEVYAQANISNLDGGSIAYNKDLGEQQVALTFFGGNSSDKKVNPNSATPLDLEFDSIVGGEIALMNDYGKIRAGYIQAKVTENSTFGLVPPELQMSENDAAFYGVGITFDYEDFLFSSEYIVRDMDDTGSPDITSYYASLGYKVGDFTPTYTYAQADSDMEFSKTPATALLPNGTPVMAVVNGARAMNLDDRTSHTLGVRYDVNAQVALKFEYNSATVTHSRYAGGTSITEVDEDINTYRIALNVIF